MRALARLRANPRRSLAAAAVVLAAAAAAVALSRRDAPAWPRPAAEPLTIAIAAQPAFALVYIADANGYLADEGLDVTFKSFALGRDALQSAILGSSDLAVAYDTPTVLQLYQGEPLGIVSTLHTSASSHALVTRRELGIRQPSDLAGKRIGVAPDTSTEYFLSLLLSSAGVAPAAVRTVALEPGEYEAAIADGRVDAVVAFNPLLFKMMQEGKGQLVAMPSDLYVETSMLLGLRETLLGRREAVTRLLRALSKAQEFAVGNREASLRIVVERLATRYPEQSIRQGWDALSFEMRLDHALVNRLTEEARWYRDNGRFPGPVPDFRSSIMAPMLAEAKPDAVSFVAPVARR